MKILHAKHAKVLGILAIVVCLMLGLAMVTIQNNFLLQLGIAATMSYFLWLGYEGITAAWVAIVGNDLLIKNGADFTRFGLDEITRVRTFPIFRYTGTLTLCLGNGRKIRTMVSDQDLTWIMAKMPLSAITPYWRKEIGFKARRDNT